MVWDVFLPLIRRPPDTTPKKVRKIVTRIDAEAATAQVHEQGQQLSKDEVFIRSHSFIQPKQKSSQPNSLDEEREIKDKKKKQDIESVDENGHLDIYI